VDKKLMDHASLFHLKATGRPGSGDAMCFDRRTNYLGEQGFRQQACFRMIRRSGRNWTAVAADEVLPIFFTKGSHTAQMLENAERGIDSLLPRFALHFAEMVMGYGSASGAHSGAQSSWLKLSGEQRHEKRDQTAVCFRKNLFGFRPENIRRVWFANSRSHARVDHKSVTLKAGKMSAHRVIRQVQRFGEFVHSGLSSQKELKDFPPCTFEEAVSPAYMFHQLKDHVNSD